MRSANTASAPDISSASSRRAAYARRRESLDWLALIKEELGVRWLRPILFRFGAAPSLTDVERQLEHFVTGRYSAAHRHPTG